MQWSRVQEWLPKSLTARLIVLFILLFQVLMILIL